MIVQSLRRFLLSYGSIAQFSKRIKNMKNQRFEKYRYQPESFYPKLSKYALNSEHELKFSDLNPEKKNIPKYLLENKKTKLILKSGARLKSGKRLKIPKLLKKFSPKTPSIQSETFPELESKEMVPVENGIIAKEDSQFNRNLPAYEDEQRELVNNQLIKLKLLKQKERNKIYNPESLIDFENEERLSKRISRLGVCSRRQAENLINKGLIKVDGKIVEHNISVNDTNQIQVFTEKGYLTPLKKTSKLWIYYKPSGYICNQRDEKKRPNILSLLNKKGFDTKHIIVIGQLDINSEGLILLTNDGDIAKALDNNSRLERCYKIRVFGRMFNEQKLEKIKNGITINFKPIKLWAEVISRQSTNTWIHIKSYNNSIIDMRLIFRKLSLRINRIIRVRFGPFTLNVCKNPNDLTEAVIPRSIKTFLSYRLKEKLKSKLRKLDDTKLEKLKNQIIIRQRIKRNNITQEIEEGSKEKIIQNQSNPLESKIESINENNK